MCLPRHALLFVFFFARSDAVRLVHLGVPDTASVGDSITLTCDYDLAEGETFLSLTWYLDDTEFASYIPVEAIYNGGLDVL